MFFEREKETIMMQPFKSGDRVAFFGDSLTHAENYIRFIRDYYFTRFPGIDLKTFNCGNAGGSATDSLLRMDFDLLNNKPDKVFVFFGMNDVDRYAYGDVEVTEEILERRRSALARYEESMEKIVRRLREANVKEIVLLSPTPYEESAKIEEENLRGVLGALQHCAEFNERLAERYGCETVDLLNPMLAINREMQKCDPTASLAGPDRVHPTVVGQAVMAYLILTAQQVPKNVFYASLGLAASTDNCAVSDVRQTEDGVEFQLVPFAMPYPPFAELGEVNRLVPFSRSLDSMPLVVRGLGAGRWSVEVDGARLTEVSAADLAAGIDLRLRSPKSEKIDELNQRCRQEEGVLRNIAKVEFMMFCAKVDPKDSAAVQSWMERYLDEVRTKPWFGYYTNLFAEYYRLKAGEADCRTALRVISEELNVDIQPISRKITLRKIAD